ncbi:nitroreductase [Macrococcus hajekii]|uniref:Nitroreductase n=1 Tax=Macrococcus hajekii TaxID=198482 RepID=A0A4R6BNR9_9STAP|nr:nitroreductase [Macrococcus hajekii]TDM03519.1 nitroreductase [Macrococcus hajekii]GGA99495.1 nitroreductase [Macrococcus hajekii]
MSFKELVKNRRSIKKYETDSHVDDEAVKEAIELAAYAPNHGMREPWRVIWVKKDRIAEYAALFGEHSFKNDADKRQKHIDTVSKLGGILIIAGPIDRRQKQHLEDVLAVGGYMQTLSLALFDMGIGSCIKSPGSMFDPGLNEALNIKDNESIHGFVYLTDLPDDIEDKPRKNLNLLTEF